MVFESEEVTIMTTDFEDPAHKLSDVNYIGKFHCEIIVEKQEVDIIVYNFF